MARRAEIFWGDQPDDPGLVVDLDDELPEGVSPENTVHFHARVLAEMEHILLQHQNGLIGQGEVAQFEVGIPDQKTG